MPASSSLMVTRDQAYRACASARFADALSESGPFETIETLLDATRDLWFNQLSATDWLEAFRGHPAIGAKANRHHQEDLSAREQSAAAASATEETSRALAEWNRRYEARFGHVFLIFASGKTSDEILAELRKRYVYMARDAPVCLSEEMVVLRNTVLSDRQARGRPSLGLIGEPVLHEKQRTRNENKHECIMAYVR